MSLQACSCVTPCFRLDSISESRRSESMVSPVGSYRLPRVFVCVPCHYRLTPSDSLGPFLCPLHYTPALAR